ncbi:aminopeptidase P family protein [Candidatus Woesearchaeota archaeon]|nr:aminopeptidase P family protein [Candidatus Woesearchaeota archaeon]
MKLKEFQQYLQEKKIDATLLYQFDLGNLHAPLYYFSRYTGYGALIIPASGKPVLVVPKLDEERATQTGLEVVSWQKIKFSEVIKKTFRQCHLGKERIGIDEDRTSIALAKVFKKQLAKTLVPIGKKISELRRTKTNDELNILREGCYATTQILNKALANFSAFKTESDVAAFLQYEAKKRGYDLSFPAVVASGKHASLPHHETGPIKLQHGFCVIDFGIRYQHYCTDMTRTVFIGKPNSGQKKLYELVLKTQRNTTRLYVEKKKCVDIDAFARKQLGNYEKYFIHSLGHGIGLEVHEAPGIGPSSKDHLQISDVVTNEPGVYIPKKLGIRIEDDVVITKKGPEVLTNKCSTDLTTL